MSSRQSWLKEYQDSDTARGLVKMIATSRLALNPFG